MCSSPGWAWHSGWPSKSWLRSVPPERCTCEIRTSGSLTVTTGAQCTSRAGIPRHAVIEAVVTHHRSGFRSGVARFNELLAERLGVPLYGLDDDGPGWDRSLLSFKVGELSDAEREALAARLETWRGEGFVHELSGHELERHLLRRAARVHCGNLEIAEAARALNEDCETAWAPGLLSDRREIEPAEVTVFSFGMAHKIRLDMFRALRGL